MDPITMMILSQALPSAINGGKAIAQGIKANKLSKIERPTYGIPQGVLDAVNQSKYLASMRELPGQNLMEGRLGQNTSKGINELKNVSANAGDLASNVARMYSGNNDALNNIGIQAGQNWMNNQNGLNQVLQTLGGYQDKQFEYNKNQPYQAAKAAESALREGAFRNLTSMGTNIASGIGGAANMMYQQNALDELTGGGPSAFGGNSGTTMPNMPTVQSPVNGGFDRKPLEAPRTIGLPQAINSVGPVDDTPAFDFQKFLDELTGQYNPTK